MNKKRYKKIFLMFQIIFSIGLLYINFKRIDIDVLKQLYVNHQINYVFFGLVLIMLILVNLLLAFRWGLLIFNQKVKKISVWQLFNIVMVSRFFSFFLPGQFSSDVYRIYILKTKGSDYSNSIGSVLFDRFFGLFVSVLIAVISIPFFSHLIDPKIMLLIYLVFSTLIIFMALAFVNVKFKLIERIVYPYRFIRTKIYKLLIFLRMIFNHKRVLIRIFFVTILFQLCMLLSRYFAFSVFTQEISFFHVVIAMPIVNILLLLPVSVNGIGQRETIYIYIFGLLGIQKEIAFSTSITIFTSLTLVSCLGGIFYFVKKIKEAKSVFLKD